MAALDCMWDGVLPPKLSPTRWMYIFQLRCKQHTVSSNFSCFADQRCKSEGIILMRAARTQVMQVLLRSLFS